MKIDELLKFAVREGASDIHFVAGCEPLIRIDGNLVRLEKFNMREDKKEMEAIILNMMTADEQEQFKQEKELDISYEIKDVARFRVNYYYERDTVGMAARIISSVIPSMEDLMMPNVIKGMLEKSHGLILVTGATGSGKSTSLASMVEYINNNFAKRIVTIEDPIEYIYKSNKSFISQRQLGEDTHSFSEALKHVFRQDPDVIMVGEMRDLETIATTITLAETGHLVLSTLHTHTAAQTIDRIIDVFPPYQQQQIRLQLSMTLSGIVSQRLLSRADGGRIANWEVLINTIPVANTIRENKVAQIQTIIQTSSQEGMLTADQDLEHLVSNGLITEDTFNFYYNGSSRKKK